MARLDRVSHGDSYPAVAFLAAESDWTEGLEAVDLTAALRSALREEYADASDEQMGDALENVFDALSPAEALNLGSALNQIGKGASRLAADPAFMQVVRTAAPVAAGLAGTALLGPAGGALFGQLASSALAGPAAPPSAAPPSAAPPPAAPPPAAPAPLPAPSPVAAAPAVVPAVVPVPAPAPAAGQPVAAAPVPGAAPAPLPETPAAPGPAPAVAGGSAAAAQALMLTQHPDALRALLSAALGELGRKRSSGIPIAQLLALLSQVFGQAAADADALTYLDEQTDAMESLGEDVYADSAGLLYADLFGADNLELAESAGWEALD